MKWLRWTLRTELLLIIVQRSKVVEVDTTTANTTIVHCTIINIILIIIYIVICIVWMTFVFIQYYIFILHYLSIAFHQLVLYIFLQPTSVGREEEQLLGVDVHKSN